MREVKLFRTLISAFEKQGAQVEQGMIRHCM